MSNSNPIGFRDEAVYRHGDTPSIGVLLANLGTPDAPTPKALRRYLKEFLKDTRVIELPRWQWLPILYGPVLTLRPNRVAKLYAAVWTEDGSPLLATGLRQRDALAERFGGDQQQSIHFALGMRYGNPSIRAALDELREKQAERILVLPLYPQYASATTGSTLDALAKEMKTWRRVPELRTINTYHDDPSYIEAMANSISDIWATDGVPEKILFSYHGIPQRYFDNGDPYHCLCHKTTRLVREALESRFDLEEDTVITTFQSQFGREQWIKPATGQTVESLARAKTRSLDIVCPGFSADCLETIEEIDVENRTIYEQHMPGDEGRFRFIPCLNDRTDHLDALEGLIRKHLQGWLEPRDDWARRSTERAEQSGRADAIRQRSTE